MSSNDTAKRNLAVMAKIAGVVKPSPVEDKSVEKIDTGLGYLMILALLVALLGVPATIDGIKSVGAYIELADQRTGYERAYEARMAANAAYRETTGESHRLANQPKATTLDTEASIAAAVAQEERFAQMIERDATIVRQQQEAQRQRDAFQSQSRIEGWVTATLQAERTENAFKNVLESRAANMAKNMTEDEMEKARELLEQRRAK